MKENWICSKLPYGSGFRRNFYKHLCSTVITKSNDLIRTIIDSWLIVKTELPNQSKSSYTRKHTSIARSYPLLWYMFCVYLEPDGLWQFFSNLKMKILTSLNNWLTSFSKLLSLSNKIKTLFKLSKDKMKLPCVCNPKQCLQ